MIPFPENKHTFKMLCENGDDKVVYCCECQVFHVHYGTVGLDLSINAMQSLMQTLELFLDRFGGLADQECRCIEVGTPYRGIRLILSVSDLRIFGAMLQDAYAAYEDHFWKPRYN
ncbi:MAG: hypothetical protein AAF990_06590 [Bacteroidota bacterium]